MTRAEIHELIAKWERKLASEVEKANAFCPTNSQTKNAECRRAGQVIAQIQEHIHRLEGLL